MAAAGPKLVAPSESVGEEEAVVLTLAGGADLVVDSCAPVELERKDGDTWTPVATTPCEKHNVATRVSSTLTLTVPAPAPGEYRAAVAWGSGCLEKMTFHLANCKKLGVVRSEVFRVGAPPDPPQPP
jgi:hypothetical protein